AGRVKTRSDVRLGSIATEMGYPRDLPMATVISLRNNRGKVPGFIQQQGSPSASVLGTRRQISSTRRLIGRSRHAISSTMSLPNHFELLATNGAARTGRLTTPHGVVQTPAFMPVGTAGAMKGMHWREVR